MKHLLVTGNKIKSLYTRKKPLEKDPHTTLVVEIKCPFKGKDLDLKIAFLLPTVSREKDENGNFFLVKNHLHYFQVQTGMAISGLPIQVKGYLSLQSILMISFGKLL